MKNLTPAYGLFYRLNNVTGNDVFWHQRPVIDKKTAQLLSEDWIDTKEKTIKKAEKLAKEMPENEIFAYHVGFMERGFRTGEKRDSDYIFHYLPPKKKK